MSSSPNKPKLKASDLPKFYGKDSEDVDQRIEKVSAIFEYSGVHDSDLLQQLPLVLQGIALTWFTQLGKERHALRTWHNWQLAFRNAFYMPNHGASLERRCLYRTLRVNESFGDCFTDKKRMQSYVFSASTPTHELIEDMTEGITWSMQPLIKANVSRYTTPEEFRRTVIDLEPGLRGRKILSNSTSIRNLSVPNYERAEKSYGTSAFSQTRVVKPVYSPPTSSHNTSSSSELPRAACYNCGGNHWRRDCPNPPNPREYSGNAPSITTHTSRSISETNWTPINENKWKQFSKTTNSIKTRSQAKATQAKEPLKMPIVNTVQPVIEDPQTSISDKQPADTTPLDLPRSQFPDNERDSWKDKTPALACGELGQPGNFNYPVCIDSGSSISIIDHDFALEHFPHLTRETCSSFELRGLGNAFVTGRLTVTVYFRNMYTVKHIPVKIRFFIAPNNTNVIRGTTCSLLAKRTSTCTMAF
jgi:hypothetical protein